MMKTLLTTILLLLVSGSASSQPKPNGAAGHFFDSNGIKIFYLDEGQGETVVLLHGFGGSSDIWAGTPVADALAKKYRVVAPDLRGHGRSEKPRDPKLYGGELAADVLRLLDHLKVEKAHVVGYSMGAAVAGKLLVTHPERLLGVTFGGGGPLFRPTKVFTDALDATAESLEKGKGVVPLVIALGPEGGPKPDPLQAAAISKLFLGDKDQRALAAVLRGRNGLAVTEEQLKMTPVPVSFVYGSLDGVVKDDIAATLKVVPNAAVTVVEKGDHMSTVASLEFRTAVVEFLDRHRGDGEDTKHIDRDAILAVLRGVEAAFSDADLERWLSFFHSTYLIMAPEGVIAPRSENEALAILRPQMEKLRSRGYAKSELRRASVKLLSTSTALASVEWTRRKSNEEELERLGATYAFYKGDKGWQIVMVTVHSPATLVELK